MVFWLVEHHNWSISEIENLIPYERDIYIGLMKKSGEETNNDHAAAMYEQMKKEQEGKN